jgi:hypothetical protein
MAAQTYEVTDGVWAWRLEHPSWSPGFGWSPAVTSTCVAAGGEIAVLDPLAPPDGDPVWARIDADPPTVVAILKPDHVRDVDRFAARYAARPFGPPLFFPNDLPETELEPIRAGSGLELPGGLVPLYDGRSEMETPMWIAQRRTLVFADALTAPDGELRVWATAWHEQAVLPALRAMLELPFEHVVVSHGEPVHDRAAFERALGLEPWRG